MESGISNLQSLIPPEMEAVDEHLTTPEIEQYGEKELGDARRAELDQHLAACSTCRARVARANRMNVALRALPRAQPPGELA
ncbi:MAG: zf-HC2 domain-containing protein, partial [Chloroflexota bacterium]